MSDLRAAVTMVLRKGIQLSGVKRTFETIWSARMMDGDAGGRTLEDNHTEERTRQFGEEGLTLCVPLRSFERRDRPLFKVRLPEVGSYPPSSVFRSYERVAGTHPCLDSGRSLHTPRSSLSQLVASKPTPTERSSVPAPSPQ